MKNPWGIDHEGQECENVPVERTAEIQGKRQKEKINVRVSLKNEHNQLRPTHIPLQWMVLEKDLLQEDRKIREISVISVRMHFDERL